MNDDGSVVNIQRLFCISYDKFHKIFHETELIISLMNFCFLWFESRKCFIYITESFLRILRDRKENFRNLRVLDYASVYENLKLYH